jgi:hypothetical protein
VLIEKLDMTGSLSGRAMDTGPFGPGHFCDACRIDPYPLNKRKAFPRKPVKAKA